MQQIRKTHVTAILAAQTPPCVSVFQPTHQSHPDNLQDLIRYRNIVREVHDALHKKVPSYDATDLLNQFHSLAHDERFWNHRTEALAILASPEIFQIFELHTRVSEHVVVADGFRIVPLLYALQAPDRFQILALRRDQVRLYEGNRYAIDRIELTQVPSTIEEALGQKLTEPHQTVASYGEGARAPHAAHGQPRMYHGHGSKKDEVDIDRDRFFRAVDRGVTQYHSRPSELPLILAAVSEYHAPFHEVSHNPYLLENGITNDPFALDDEEMRAKAWCVIEPHYQQRIARLVDDFGAAQKQNIGTDDFNHIQEAAKAGRIDTLLIDRVQESTGADASGDTLDELAKVVLRMNGEVIVLDPDAMPTDARIAAILRY